ncbi:MAG: hypothetical protein D6714_11200, partial [Bacteroidetes bacterium]
CNTGKYLEDGQTYLKQNTIEFAKGKKIKNKAALEYELSTLYKQTPNQKFLWVPRRYFYFSSKDTLERNRGGKAIKRFEGRRLAEPPIWFEEEKARQTAESMKYYLQNKGYFQAQTDFSYEHNKKHTKTCVTYKVAPGGLYKIDTVFFESRDTAIARILAQISDQTFLKKGKPVDVNLYNQEVNRITVHLRNTGYAFFQPRYVGSLEALDSTNFRVRAKLEVLPPKDRESHQVYHIGDITVYPNFGQTFDLEQLPDTIINGIQFVTNGHPFRVKPETLLNSISLTPGNLYRKSDETNTNLQLSSLGVFSFVTIKSEPDPEREGILNFRIQLTQNKKWEFSATFDINQTSRRGEVVNRNLVGVFLSPALKSRNLFKGAELMISSLDAGVELAPLRDTILNTVDLKIKADLYYPRFVDYFGLWRTLRKAHLIDKDYFDAVVGRANSRVSAGYNFYSLLDFYSYNLFNFSFGYDVQRSPSRRFITNNLGIDFLAPRPQPAFQAILDQNPFLANSFSRQLFTGFLFRDFTYIYSPPNRIGGTWYFQGNAEISGLEVFGLNTLYNTLAGKSDVWKISDVEFSQYIRLEADLRRYWQNHSRRALVGRLAAGIVIPFGHSDEAPYVKQFFVGGPQSIRGMYARGIGPGAYHDPATEDFSRRNFFYQTGDIKIEWNLEYRFHLFRPLNLFDFNGALFIDGGNIWTLDADERPGTKFNPANVLREMVISVGTGTRWDFNYFILYLDLGTIVRYNYPLPGTNSYWADFSSFNFRDRVALHFGIGYPF